MASDLRRISALGALLVLVATTGCLGALPKRSPVTPRGYLFTWATVPLTTDYQKTPVVATRDNHGSVFELRWEFYHVPVSVHWGDNSIGGLGKEAGFDEVYYADLTTFSIWTVFKMERVRVYGHRAGTPPVAPAP
jgi:hypothetical protein